MLQKHVEYSIFRKCSTVFFALLASLFLGGTALAAQNYTEGYFEYQVEEASVTIVRYYGKESEVTVPSMIAGNPVSRIAKGAFGSSTTVKKVSLPDTIMTIEEGAFQNGIQIVYNSGADEPGNGQRPPSDGSQGGAPDGSQNGASNGVSSDETNLGTIDGTDGIDDAQTGIDGAEVQLPEEPKESDKTGQDVLSEQDRDGGKLWIGIVAAAAVLTAGVAVLLWEKKRRKKNR